jgi:hypothetical protein
MITGNNVLVFLECRCHAMLWFQFSERIHLSFLLDMQDQSKVDQLITNEAYSWKTKCFGTKHILDPVGHCFLLVNVIMHVKLNLDLPSVRLNRHLA